MENIKKSLESVREDIERREKRKILTFDGFFEAVRKNPQKVLRNIFQLFQDFVITSIREETEEYPDDPESIGFVRYDCAKLFAEGMDDPFFPDRLFANRFVRLVRQMKIGAAQQNKVYIFVGPHGCGKSVFLNNLLAGFGRYTDSDEGELFEIVWKIDPAILKEVEVGARGIAKNSDRVFEIPCPSHDNPFLIFPKRHRREILKSVLPDSEIKDRILGSKEYEWLFKDPCCSICRSIFYLLLDRLQSFEEVQKYIYARSCKFDRVLGEGISVFSPGDRPARQVCLTDKELQEEIGKVFGSSTAVRYLFSRYAKTNGGIYVLMDIKDYNKERFEELRGIVSEGMHKLDECVEESVRSLFFVICNPGDLVINNFDEGEENKKDGNRKNRRMSLDQAFKDRLEYISIPYVTEVHTETAIYKSVFGEKIESRFLPGVFENFARVIISSRLIKDSPALKGWLGDDFGERYKKYCDKDGLILKMAVYSGVKPSWLAEEDVRGFTKEHRKNLILKEGEKEGGVGFSGRESIGLFNDFFSVYGSLENNLITMADLNRFFKNMFKSRPHYKEIIPKVFLKSLTGSYNYMVVQQIKESLYDYNEERVKKDIVNYIFALTHEAGEKVACPFTGETVEVMEDFLAAMEDRIWGADGWDDKTRKESREALTEIYARLLAKEGQSLNLVETEWFEEIFKSYMFQLKEKVMDPFLKNKGFRQAVKVYGENEFGTFDKRIRDSVELLMANLRRKYGYTKEGAKQACIYVLDNKIAEEFAK